MVYLCDVIINAAIMTVKTITPAGFRGGVLVIGFLNCHISAYTKSV